MRRQGANPAFAYTTCSPELALRSRARLKNLDSTTRSARRRTAMSTRLFSVMSSSVKTPVHRKRIKMRTGCCSWSAVEGEVSKEIRAAYYPSCH